MKLRITRSRPSVILTSALSIITISIACTYKSAGSPPLRNGGAEAQTPVQTSRAATQEKPQCTLTLLAAPTINGIKLGMSKQEILSLFPGDKEGADLRVRASQPDGPFGMTSLSVAPVESKDHFTGISNVTFRLVNGRLYNFRIGYNGPAWPGIDKFVEKFGNDNSLPPASHWEAYVGMDNQLKTLNCAGFSVQLFVGGQGGNLNYADITDVAADKELKDRRAKARAQASPTP